MGKVSCLHNAQRERILGIFPPIWGSVEEKGLGSLQAGLQENQVKTAQQLKLPPRLANYLYHISPVTISPSSGAITG